MTTVPVGRRFFNEFLDDTPALPDGSKPKQPWVEPAIPADQKTDLSQPVFGINHPTAVTFCNWLSRREALDPCYRYLEQPTNSTRNAADKEKYLMGAPSQARLPKPPWEADESANGYRLPTPDQYAYIVRCQYRRGVPWRHAKTLAQIGGAYAPPPGQEFPRPLFSLMPNRMGLFVNDTQCGTWVLGRGKGTCMAVEGKHAYLNIRPTRISKDHSIYLVQLENDTTN